MKRRAAAAAVALAVLALAGCSYRSVDPVVSGAQAVPGTGSLNRFCDQTTLIYVSIVPGDADNFEAFFLNGCAKNPAGQYVPAIAAGPPQQESTNQMDERDEGR